MKLRTVSCECVQWRPLCYAAWPGNSGRQANFTGKMAWTCVHTLHWHWKTRSSNEQERERELLGELRECTRASGSPPQRQWSSLPAVITHHCHFRLLLLLLSLLPLCLSASTTTAAHQTAAFAKLPNTRLLLLQSTSSAFLSQVELLGSVSHLTSETVYALVAEVDILLSSFDD